MSGMEKIKKTEIPGLKRSLKDVLFKEFEQLENDDALKIEMQVLGYSLGGVSYAVRVWNRTHSKIIKMKVVDARSAPIVYLYVESKVQDE